MKLILLTQADQKLLVFFPKISSALPKKYSDDCFLQFGTEFAIDTLFFFVSMAFSSPVLSHDIFLICLPSTASACACTYVTIVCFCRIPRLYLIRIRVIYLFEHTGIYVPVLKFALYVNFYNMLCVSLVSMYGYLLHLVWVCASLHHTYFVHKQVYLRVIVFLCYHVVCTFPSEFKSCLCRANFSSFVLFMCLIIVCYFVVFFCEWLRNESCAWVGVIHVCVLFYVGAS